MHQAARVCDPVASEEVAERGDALDMNSKSVLGNTRADKMAFTQVRAVPAGARDTRDA